MAKAKLRHLAIAVQDPEKAAKFFVDVFDMEQRGIFNVESCEGCYVSDGYITIALIKYKAARELGAERDLGYEGLHHFGFQVADVDEYGRRIVAAGFHPRDDMNEGLRDIQGAEIKYAGPGGTVIDISDSGWDNVAAMLFPELNAGLARAK